MTSPTHINSTGYGPSGSCWNNLAFNGDDRCYKKWETKFLGYMKLKKLKSMILPNSTAADTEKNQVAFAEMIQFLDDVSLSLVMRDAKEREALAILRRHYRGKGKQRIICLYTELTSLVKLSTENVTEYIIRAENAATALRDADEVECQTFDKIKSILSSPPILYTPCKGDKFILETDASDIGIGGCLKAKNGQCEHIVGYCSKKFSNSELNWNIVEKEVFAVVHNIANSNISW